MGAHERADHIPHPDPRQRAFLRVDGGQGDDDAARVAKRRVTPTQ
jgi:hypothetical protein